MVDSLLCLEYDHLILCIPSLQEREHDSEDEDEDKYADDIDMPGQNFDSKRRITVRNLRIREDTAKVRDTCGNTSLFSTTFVLSPF